MSAAEEALLDLSLPYLPFNLNDTTVTALSQRYLDQAPKLSTSLFPAPTPDDIAFYLHTSSASTVSNVKCVPISHKNVINGSQSRLSWFKKVWPQQDFNHLRVLGWSPWSHIIGLSHDIGAATLLTAGCYVFGALPSAYPAGADVAKNASRYLDVPTQLLNTAISKKTTAFAGVPWVLEGFMKAWKNESDEAQRARIMQAIKLFKVFGSGGASTGAECIEWAKQVGLPVLLDLGMTEVGGMIQWLEFQ
jgi:acyl-CoA synthetase (AMP-forming)/AMP-acid ligase II